MDDRDSGGQLATSTPTQIDDPSIFWKAWNAFHDACVSQTSPVPEPDPVPDFKKFEEESRLHEDKVNNNFLNPEEMESDSEFPDEQSSISGPQRRTRTRPRRIRPTTMCVSGVNTVLEEADLPGVHLSTQAENTAREYQALLDGVKSFYPFIPEKSGSKVKQTAKYISSNQQFGNPSRRPQFHSEETFLFHPSKKRKEEGREKIHDTRLPFKKIADLYPTPSEAWYHMKAGTVEYVDLSGELEAKLERGFDEQELQKFCDEALETNRLNGYKSSLPLREVQIPLLPEVHNTNLENQPNVRNHKSRTSDQHRQRNCNQNNNVNINLTLALQQQNGDLYSTAPVVVKYSTSEEQGQNQLVPRAVAMPRSRKRTAGAKSSMAMQTELPTIVKQCEFQRREPISMSKLEATTIDRMKAPLLIDTKPGVTRLLFEDLQDYCNVQEPEPESVVPEEPEEDEVEIDLNDWTSNAVSVSKMAVEYTEESMTRVLEVADDIVKNCVYLPDERKQLSAEELRVVEEKLSVALMRLVGIKSPHRHEIYETTKENIEAIQDLSKGTISMLGSVINWFAKSEDPEMPEAKSSSEFLNKLRILATVNSEIDPDSDVWKEFESEVGVYAEAVTDAVGTGFEAAKSVSRRCSETIMGFLGPTPNQNVHEEEEASNSSNLESIQDVEMPVLGHISLESIEELPEEEHEIEVLPVAAPSASATARARKSPSQESSQARSRGRKGSSEKENSYRLQYKMRLENEKAAENSAKKSPARSTSANRKSTEKSRSRPRPEIPSASVEALHQQSNDLAPPDITGTSLESVQVASKTASIGEVTLPLPVYPPVDPTFIEGNTHQFNYGIASTIASAAETITSTLWNYFPSFLSSNTENLKAETNDREIIPVPDPLVGNEAALALVQEVDNSNHTSSTREVHSDVRLRARSLDRQGSSTSSSKIPKAATPRRSESSTVHMHNSKEFSNKMEERSGIPRMSLTGLTRSTPEKSLIQACGSGVTLAAKNSSKLLVQERKSSFGNMLTKIKPYLSPTKLITIELPTQAGLPSGELDGNALNEPKLQVITNENIRPSTPTSRIPLPKSIGNAANSRLNLDTESAATISLYPPHPVRISSVAIANPISTTRTTISSRTARSVPPKQEMKPKLAHGSESSRLPSRIATNTKSTTRPIRAQHFPNQQQSVEVIDISPMQNSNGPAQTQGSNTNFTNCASPSAKLSTTMVKRYKSKTSYKQIMDEKKEYLAKSGTTNIPSYKYTSTIGTPVRPVVQKARTLQAKTNNNSGSGGSLVGLRGSRSSCTGRDSGSNSFIHLNS